MQHSRWQIQTRARSYVIAWALCVIIAILGIGRTSVASAHAVRGALDVGTKYAAVVSVGLGVSKRTADIYAGELIELSWHYGVDPRLMLAVLIANGRISTLETNGRRGVPSVDTSPTASLALRIRSALRASGWRGGQLHVPERSVAAAAKLYYTRFVQRHGRPGLGESAREARYAASVCRSYSQLLGIRTRGPSRGRRATMR
jgi:hypothetical protein